MKDYSEMAEDVFHRRDEYKTVQQKRRRTAAKAAIMMTCFLCIITASCIVISESSMFNPEFSKTVYNAPDNTSVSTSPDISDNTSGNFQNTVIINNIDGISSARMNICLSENDFILMNKDELKEYYGTTVFPSVPSDLEEWDVGNEYDGYGIYRRGNGEIYWDQNIINYSNDDYTRSVNIELHKGSLPFSDYGQLSSGERKITDSVINGEKVRIGRTESGYYLTEFIHKNVGFRMVTEGLSEEELIFIISSLIEPSVTFAN